MSDIRDLAGILFETGAALFNSIPPRKRNDVDEVEVVFVDIVNGKSKPRREFTFQGILVALQDGSKPVGLTFIHWQSADKMSMKAFPGLSPVEESTLAEAFAEAQDQQREEFEGDGA